MRLISIHWPIVIVVTVVLYFLLLFSLVVDTVMATIFLFTIIGFWSRLPGVGIPHPFFILYQADIIDVCMLIISIHVSPFHAILYAIFCNLASRSAGVFPTWTGVFMDCAIMSAIALIAPLLYLVFGNIIIVVGIYSVLRIIGFIFFKIIISFQSIPQIIIEESGAAVAVFLINVFYAKLFGNFFETLLQKGVAFNWLLFFIVTAVILLFSIVVFGFSPVDTGKKSMKTVAIIARHVMHKKKEEVITDDISQFDEVKKSIDGN